jgi:ketosteroid isomerase-like protein
VTEGPTSVEAVNRAYAAWNSGDLDAFLETVEPSGTFPDITDHYEGHQGVRDFWRDFVTPWESLSIEFTDVREFSEHEVAIKVRFRGHGRGGIEVEQDFGQRYRIEHGLLVHMRSFRTWEEALAA